MGLAKWPANGECSNFRQQPGIRSGRSRGNSAHVRDPSPNEKTNPAQRLRHELRGASIARAVDPSARPHPRLQPPALLARSGEDAGARAVRRAVSRRRARRLRRVRQQPGRGAAQRRADAGQRAADADPGDGRRDRTSRLRRHQQPVVRAALPVCAADVDARSPHRRPDRLERGDRLSRQRRPRRRQGQADRA